MISVIKPLHLKPYYRSLPLFVPIYAYPAKWMSSRRTKSFKFLSAQAGQLVHTAKNPVHHLHRHLMTNDLKKPTLTQAFLISETVAPIFSPFK